jgi:hypothetical protein
MMRFPLLSLLVPAVLLAATAPLFSQSPAKPKPEDTEIWEPVPKVVTPGATCGAPPSDAIVLFDGKNLDEWVTNRDKSPAKWDVADGVMTVNKAGGSIETKRSFKNYQLHLEWKVPTNITGTGQARGNSGVFLASTGPGDDGYELQVLDSYENKTYVNGMAGSLYKQAIPLANPTRKPGEWQTYATVFFNGVLVENHFELKGQTLYIGKPFYKAYTSAPIKLQAHGDKSEPISFRNIWIREIE